VAGPEGRHVVYCADGWVWALDVAARRWEELPPLPGSPADPANYPPEWRAALRPPGPGGART